MSTPGERLKEERLALGLTQAQLGEVGGVRKRAQLAYEKGTRSPDTTYLTRIAAAGVDVGYVVTGEIHKAPAARAALGQTALYERVQKGVRECGSWLDVALRQLQRCDRVDALDSLRFAERHVKRAARVIAQSLRESRTGEAE